MNHSEIMQQTMKMLLDKGAQKVQLWLDTTTTDEFNVVFKELNLFRSLESQSYSIVVIKDQKQATTSLNQIDINSITGAVNDVMSAVEAANEDPAFDISPYQEPMKIEKGPQQGNLDKICLRLSELTEKIKNDYPSVLFDAIMSYVKSRDLYLNSNGTQFEEIQGYYRFTLMFSAKEGEKMTSLNYTGFALADLEKKLMDINFTELLVQQITEQTVTKPIPGNFTGDLLLMPAVTSELLATLLDTHTGNNGIIMKTSRFPNHLNKKILDDKITVRTEPLNPEMCLASHILSDGFIAENATIIDRGVLKHYSISIYVSNKTGMKRTIGPNNTYVIQNGDVSYKEIISQIDKGIFCPRISYGSPNVNGDFSGVLKNCYYIENGKLMYPIRETMMSANLIDMFNNVAALSSETVNTGGTKAPFTLIKDIYFSK